MKPTNIILDLLRTYPVKGTSVQAIMETGDMFGFSANLMRVSLSRLVTKEVLENHQRGFYRLSQTTNPINAFVEQWRQGEERQSSWQAGRWLALHFDTSISKKGTWALDACGFRAIKSRLWIRPDNLNLPHQQLEHQLKELGLDNAGIFIGDAVLADDISNVWLNSFDIDAMNKTYRDMHVRLSSSMRRLRTLDATDAKRESFDLGGEAISLLAKDPLIPHQYQAPAERIRLWQTMLSYDEAGKKVWANLDSPDLPNSIPISSAASLS